MRQVVKVGIIIVVISVFLFSCNNEQLREENDTADNLCDSIEFGIDFVGAFDKGLMIAFSDGSRAWITYKDTCLIEIDTFYYHKKVPTIEEIEHTRYCDSLLNESKSFLRYYQKTYKCKISDLIELKGLQKLTVSQAVEKISNKYQLIDNLIIVNPELYIESYICYFLINDDDILQLIFCFHQPLPPSCCGIGGQFATENTLDYEKHQMNYEIIKDLKDYTIFQFVGYDWILGATEIRMQRKNKQQDYNDN